jgi:hypothetical protein
VNIEGGEKELFSDSCHSWLSKTDMLLLSQHDHFVRFAAQTCFRALSRYDYWLYPDMSVIDKKTETTMFPMPETGDANRADNA